jgi:hypothetical protein
LQKNKRLLLTASADRGAARRCASASRRWRPTDHGLTWSDPISGPGIETLTVSDPETSAPVRVGEPITDITVDPRNGNLYAVWADGRFSGYAHDDIAFSMSTDGGLTWSAPIKVNQTPATTPAGNAQAFTPSVAVNSDGTVAVTYYDFRNNTAAAGLPTDYWISHADSNFTNPTSWSAENRLTASSFNMENAPVAGGYFVGDYEGLAAAGQSFYALFAQAGASNKTDRSNMFFRDPPPAAAAPSAGTSASAETAPAAGWAIEAAGLQGGAAETSSVAGPSTVDAQVAVPAALTAAPPAGSLLSEVSTAEQVNGDRAPDGDLADGLAASLSLGD